MIILRDEKRIQRLKKIGQYVSFLGMGILLLGLVIIFWAIKRPFIPITCIGNGLGCIAGWYFLGASLLTNAETRSGIG